MAQNIAKCSPSLGRALGGTADPPDSPGRPEIPAIARRWALKARGGTCVPLGGLRGEEEEETKEETKEGEEEGEAENEEDKPKERSAERMERCRSDRRDAGAIGRGTI